MHTHLSVSHTAKYGSFNGLNRSSASSDALIKVVNAAACRRRLVLNRTTPAKEIARLRRRQNARRPP